ncbi:MAG: hypothetical protein AAFO99_11565 [Bacteroidota bacterium]
MKNLFLSLFLVLCYSGISQDNLNTYKYIIVPKTFDGFKKENQYQTSTLIKYLFVQKGFNVVYDDNLPEDLTVNRCLGLLVDLVDDSSMFSTRTAVALKDCGSQEVFRTQVGKSKLKEFKPAYAEAIRRSFESLDGFAYTYSPKKEQNDAPITVSFKDDVKKLEDSKEKVASDAPSKNMVQQEATLEDQSFKSLEPVESEIKKVVPNPKNEISPTNSVATKPEMPSAILYAQELPNGYQLVDSTPTIRLKMLKTSVNDFYLAKSVDKDGVVYEKEGAWFFEYYENENLVIKELNIKF